MFESIFSIDFFESISVSKSNEGVVAPMKKVQQYPFLSF